ncbi:MAG: aldo/keto reductase [Defluviitaleaceae bacterium]|nr:aldo/keto reductase [Defluviitaleaceae bacterium]
MNKNVQDFIKKHNIPKLGFGGMRFPTIGGDDKVIDVEKVKEMVDAYVEAGFNYFDTAYFYHGGKSEETLKEAVTKRYPRESYTIVDKLPIWSCETPADGERIFNEQLERCGVDYFDIYLLHALNGEGSEKHEQFGNYDFLLRMKAEGKIKSFGFSFHGTTECARKIMEKHHDKFDIVMLQINYFDWLKDYRDQYEIIKSYDKPIVVMEPVRGGMLSRLPENIANIFTEANPNVSQASWAVRWVGSLPNVITVLSGMSNMEQVRDNISSLKDFVPLSADEHAVVDKAAHALANTPQVPCTLCNYCVDCPMGIPIPKIFELYNKYLEARNMWGLNTGYKEIDVDKRAGACTSCGVCVEVCPQNIDIPGVMKEIATLMNG